MDCTSHPSADRFAQNYLTSFRNSLTPSCGRADAVRRYFNMGLVMLLLLAATIVPAEACSVWLQVHLPKTGGTYFRELAKEAAEIQLVSGLDEAMRVLSAASSPDDLVMACEFHGGGFDAVCVAWWAPFALLALGKALEGLLVGEAVG